MFVKSIVAVICCLGAVSLTHAGVKLGELVTACSLKDPKLNECLLTMGTKMLPLVIAGSREWDVVPLDPLLIPHMELQNGAGSGGVDLSVTLHNSSHSGRKGLRLKSIKCNPKTLDFEVHASIPRYDVAGTYKANGRILLLPLTGNGPAKLSFIDTDVTYTFKTKPEEREGKKYLKVSNFKTAFNVGKLVMNLENLFGNKQLSDTMNTFLNEHSAEVFADLKTTTEDLMTSIDSAIATKLFSKIPINQVLKDLD